MDKIQNTNVASKVVLKGRHRPLLTYTCTQIILIKFKSCGICFAFIRYNIVTLKFHKQTLLSYIYSSQFHTRDLRIKFTTIKFKEVKGGNAKIEIDFSDDHSIIIGHISNFFHKKEANF